MKNVKIVRENISRVLDFDTELQMVYFVIKYQDLFKPYCEDTVKTARRYDGEEAAFLASLGITSWWYADEGISRINVNFKNREAFESVEHLFVKKPIRKNKSSYVYVGEP